MIDHSVLGKRLCYQFDNPELLVTALTHRSASKKHYERMEFLGDAILNLIITDDLYNRFSDATEGKLRRLRASLVKGETLSQMAKEARQSAATFARDGLAACQGSDLIMAGMGGLYVAIALGEKLQLPVLQAHLVPFTPTQAFPGAPFSRMPSSMGKVLNRASHHILRQMLWQGFRSAVASSDQWVLLPIWALPITSGRQDL